MKTALITGISGQDGAYLAQVLLRGYKVVGTHRRTSDTNFWRLRELSLDDHPRLSLITHDVTDLSSAIRLMELVQPGEIYNLAAQTHVGNSSILPWSPPEHRNWLSVYVGSYKDILVPSLGSFRPLRPKCSEARNQTNNRK